MAITSNTNYQISVSPKIHCQQQERGTQGQ